MGHYYSEQESNYPANHSLPQQWNPKATPEQIVKDLAHSVGKIPGYKHQPYLISTASYNCLLEKLGQESVNNLLFIVVD